MLTKQSKVSIPVSNMEKGSSTKQTIYIRAHKIGDKYVTIKVCAHYLFSKLM